MEGARHSPEPRGVSVEPGRGEPTRAHSGHAARAPTRSFHALSRHARPRPASPLEPGGGPDLADRYAQVRAFTMALVRDLAPEDMVVQSMDDVSPTKWHLAHTSWFWEVFVLEPHLPGYEALDPAYHFLFNSYYVQAGERHCRAQRGWLSRAHGAQVMAYREHVDQGMARLLADRDRLEGDAARRAGGTGLNHEQQHQELMLTDLKHVFGVNPLRPAYHEAPEAGARSGRRSCGGPRRHGAAPRLRGV
jgi:hypothetical protein